MNPDNKQRHAVGFYVDLRLGVTTEVPLTKEAAYAKTARRYGFEAASYARQVAN